MIQHLIDGTPVDSRERFETLNPATGEPIAEVASGTELEVDAAGRAFPAWPAKPAAERARLTRKPGGLIAADVPELSALETQDTAQPIAHHAG